MYESIYRVDFPSYGFIIKCFECNYNYISESELLNHTSMTPTKLSVHSNYTKECILISCLNY